ncbi:hypothetical protein [Microbulbifer sp. PAAF003]|uniref:hypothetical protein n=1 Tax=Microbulbifer sp. PAAF003 TaxID=3243375 RepID=UPI004039CD40
MPEVLNGKGIAIKNIGTKMILLDFIQFVLVSKLRKIDRYLLVFWPELGGLL